MTEGAKMRNAEAKTGAQRSAVSAAQIAWVALLGCVALVIAAGFALTYHGMYGFGREVAHWGPALAALGPVACDGLTLVAIAATFLLAYAAAPRRPRVYAWFVFAVSCAVSIAGNTAFALRPLPVWVGAVGAALCPVLVTLASHLGVVCWRHCAPSARDTRTGGRADAGISAAPSPRPAAPLAVTPPPAGPSLTPIPRQKSPAPPSRGRGGAEDRKAEARRRYAAGEPLDKVHESWPATPVRPSRRTLDNWTADLRAQHAEAKAARNAASTSPVSGGGVRSVSDLTVRSGVSGPPMVPVNGVKVPAAASRQST